MPSSQSEWDAKHQLAGEDSPSEPVDLLREILPMLPAGPVLDLACGRGRNALYLAERGHPVIAVDWSGVALASLEAFAERKKIAVRRIGTLGESGSPRQAGLELLQGDLEKIELPACTYDVILCIRYLQRKMFPQISQALRRGGILLYETYTEAQLEFEGGPRDAAHLLRPGELREAFPDLCLLFYRELRAGQGIASLVARKPDRKG
jgi:SAM-dependent methyltransferase